MKISLQIVVASLLTFVGPTLSANPLTACPVLAGEYQDGENTKTIFETRSGSRYLVTLGEGAFAMTVDGQIRSTPGGEAQYQALCMDGALLVKVSAGGQSGLMKYYFKNPQTLIEENSGFEESTRIWIRK